jgi:hypothetical protein
MKFLACVDWHARSVFYRAPLPLIENLLPMGILMSREALMTGIEVRNELPECQRQATRLATTAAVKLDMYPFSPATSYEAATG